MLAEAEQVPAFAESLRAHLHANPKIVQGKRFSTLLDHVYKNAAVVGLSSFWLLSFDDILAVTETVAGSEHGFCLFLPNLEDLTASNFRKLLSSGFIRELRVGKHQVGDLGPLPRELTAFASRYAARTPSPFVPTLPLEQGRYTIVIFYEHSLKEDKGYPLGLPYGFATLDSKAEPE